VLALPKRQRRELLECYFRDQLARLLRLDPAAVDLQQPVNSFGLDSLTTLGLKNALERSLGVALPISTFLQGASTAQLVAKVLADLSPPVADPVSADVGTILRGIRQLHDNPVRREVETEKTPG
jgi:acyl carrier protein